MNIVHVGNVILACFWTQHWLCGVDENATLKTSQGMGTVRFLYLILVKIKIHFGEMELIAKTVAGKEAQIQLDISMPGCI